MFCVLRETGTGHMLVPMAVIDDTQYGTYNSFPLVIYEIYKHEDGEKRVLQYRGYVFPRIFFSFYKRPDVAGFGAEMRCVESEANEKRYFDTFDEAYEKMPPWLRIADGSFYVDDAKKIEAVGQFERYEDAFKACEAKAGPEVEKTLAENAEAPKGLDVFFCDTREG